jgi:N-acetylglucosamine malate deacetylase 1
LINAPEDRHPDHGRASQLLIDASFYSGLSKIETVDSNAKKQDQWRPKQIFHYIQDRYIKPDFVVDITAFWPKKMEAMQAFKSQFYEPNAEGVQSYISSKDFTDFIEARAREMGHPCGFTYGEGFISNKTLGVKNLFNFV